MDQAFASAEHAMQVPALHVAMLAINPERLAVRVRRQVVMAAHLFAIPPSGLDALRAGDEIEGSLIAGMTFFCDEALGTIEKPRGTKIGDRPRFPIERNGCSATREIGVCPRF